MLLFISFDIVVSIFVFVVDEVNDVAGGGDDDDEYDDDNDDTKPLLPTVSIILGDDGTDNRLVD